MRNGRLVNLVTLADLLVRQQHLGYSGNYVLTDRGPLLAAVGLTPADADAVVAALVGHMEPRATALGLNQATGDELYRSALTRANRELGHIGSQLAAKNRRLEARKRYFDAGQAFQAELRPEAVPGRRAPGRRPHGRPRLLGTSAAVAAFSLPPGTTAAEAIAVDAAGAVQAHRLTSELPTPPAATTAVAEAGPDMEPVRVGRPGRGWPARRAVLAAAVGRRRRSASAASIWGAAAGEPARLESQLPRS